MNAAFMMPPDRAPPKNRRLGLLLALAVLLYIAGVIAFIVIY